jgi:hypothetical protein
VSLTQHSCCLSAGYLSFRSGTDGIILDNFTGHYADVFRIMLVIHMVLYIPVDFMTMRHSLVKLCGNATGQVPSDIGHLAITLFLLCCKLWLHYPLNCVIWTCVVCSSHCGGVIVELGWGIEWKRVWIDSGFLWRTGRFCHQFHHAGSVLSEASAKNGLFVLALCRDVGLRNGCRNYGTDFVYYAVYLVIYLMYNHI